jgi:RNA polymerase sigma-70 factor (ECF subfamily)
MTRQESTLLLQQARAGSADALGVLYGRLAPRLLALIRMRMGSSLRSRLESRDILQATLLRSFERLDQFDGGDSASLMSWLARIAENELRDQADFQHRQRRDIERTVPLDAAREVAAAGVRSALSQAVLGEQAESLERALDQLETDHREVILLRKFEELSFKEIAARMDRSEDACRMLFTRAMTRLTLQMADRS